MARRKGVPTALATSRVCRSRVSNIQKEAMMNYMERHLLFARGQVARPQGHITYKNMWSLLAMELNRLGPCIKDVLGWQRYWTTIRLAAKQEKATFMSSLNKTGHNAPDVSFSEFNERVSCIFGKFGTGINLSMELGMELVQNSDDQDFLDLISDMHTLADYIQTAMSSTSAIQDVQHRFDENMREMFQDGPRTCQKPSEGQFAILFATLREKYLTLNEPTDNPLTAQEWQDLGATLNQEGGVTKTARAWMKTWLDLLHSARQAMTLMLNEERLSPLCENHIMAIDLAGYRVAPSKRPSPMATKKSCAPTFCGFAQLLPRAESPYPPSEDEGYDEPQPKKLKLSSSYEPIASTSRCNYPAPLPGPSTPRQASSTVTQKIGAGNSNSNRVSDRSSKLLQSLERKGTEITDNLFSRVQNAFEEQLMILQRSFQEQNNMLIEALTAMVEQAIARHVDYLQRLNIVQAQPIPAQEIPAQQIVAPNNPPDEVIEAVDDKNLQVLAEEVLEDCIICQGNCTRPTELSCGHRFCFKCIRKWLQKSSTCPFCRRNVELPEEISFRDGMLVFNIDSDSD